jgi:hypothetical protein
MTCPQCKNQQINLLSYQRACSNDNIVQTPLNMTSFGNICKDRAVWQNMRCPQFKYETIIPWSVFEDSLNGRRRKKLFLDFGTKLTENPSDIRSRRIFVDVIFDRLHRDVEHSDNLFESRSVGRDGTSVESD